MEALSVSWPRLFSYWMTRRAQSNNWRIICKKREIWLKTCRMFHRSSKKTLPNKNSMTYCRRNWTSSLVLPTSAMPLVLLALDTTYSTPKSSSLSLAQSPSKPPIVTSSSVVTMQKKDFSEKPSNASKKQLKLEVLWVEIASTTLVYSISFRDSYQRP